MNTQHKIIEIRIILNLKFQIPILYENNFKGIVTLNLKNSYRLPLNSISSVDIIDQTRCVLLFHVYFNGILLDRHGNLSSTLLRVSYLHELKHNAKSCLHSIHGSNITHSASTPSATSWRRSGLSAGQCEATNACFANDSWTRENSTHM